jgi:16S rRNA (guanine527-N7)-methyltransferase
MITHHLLDSLAVLPHLPAAGSLRLIDIGSGGGLPGIPLAIARPAWQVTLLDSNRKKGTFLQQGINELGLGNSALAMARVEEYEPSERFDIAIARAFSDLASFAAAATPLVTAEGRLVAMKGVYPRDEIAALPRSIRVVAVPALQVPGVDAERHLVIMERANKERAEA